MDIFDVLVKQMDDKIQQLQEAVTSGKSETFEEYKRICGEIKGLLTARGYVLDLKDKVETSDD